MCSCNVGQKYGELLSKSPDLGSWGELVLLSVEIPLRSLAG